MNWFLLCIVVRIRFYFLVICLVGMFRIWNWVCLFFILNLGVCISWLCIWNFFLVMLRFLRFFILGIIDVMVVFVCLCEWNLLNLIGLFLSIWFVRLFRIIVLGWIVLSCVMFLLFICIKLNMDFCVVGFYFLFFVVIGRIRIFLLLILWICLRLSVVVKKSLNLMLLRVCFV